MKWIPLFTALATLSLPVQAAGDDAQWTPLPEETATVLLLTGADRGYVAPRGCNKERGGMQYRPAFDAWLAERRPRVERVWLGTGNWLATKPGLGRGTPGEIIELYAEVGYAKVGVGANELYPAHLDVLWDRLGRERGAPQPVCTNLQVFETGEPAFAPRVLLDTQAGRVAVLSLARHDRDAVSGLLDTGSLLTLEPVAALREALDESAGRADFTVLLTTLSADILRSTLREVDGVDLAVSGAGDLRRNALDRDFAAAPVLWVGDEGQMLGRLALGPGGRLLDARAVTVEPPEFPVPTKPRVEDAQKADYRPTSKTGAGAP